MKKIFLISIVIIFFISICYLYKSIFYIDLLNDDEFEKLDNRVIMINYYAYKAMADKIDYNDQRNKKKLGILDQWYLKKIFKALPRDQKTFYMIYAGPENINMGGPINPWGEFKFFTDTSSFNREFHEFRIMNMKIGTYVYHAFYEFINYIPKDVFLEKMISIGIGGTYCSSTYVYNVLMKYIENALKHNSQDILLLNTILEKHTDKEICAFWFFIFAGPHPKNYEKYCVQLSKYLSPRVSKLMNEAYQYLISQPHCTGH